MSPWRKTFYAVWVGQVFSIMGFMFVLPLLPLYIRELGIEDRAELVMWSGRVSAAAGLTMVIFAPIWGAVADKYGRKMMVLRSMFGGAVVLLLMGYARNVTDLLVLRMMQGALTGTISASVALVSSVTPRERSGFTLGMMQAAAFVGASIGPFLGGAMAEHFGFRATFVTAAIVLAAGGLVVKFLAREEFEPPEPSNAGRFHSFTEIFGAAGFVAALVALFFIRFANSAFQPVFPLYVEELLGSREGVRALTGRIIGVAGITAAFSAAYLGRFSDRWGHKRLLVASTLFAGAVTLPLAFAQNVPHLYVLRALFGLAAAGIMPSANAIIRRIIHEKHLGKAYGIMGSVTCLGWGLGPLTGAWLAAGMGLRAPFVLTGVILLLTAPLVMWRVR